MVSHNQVEGRSREVERIIDKTISKKRRRTLYLVKWKNLNEDQSTWVPEEELTCPSLIAAFNEELEVQSDAAETDVSSSGPTANLNIPAPTSPVAENAATSKAGSASDAIDLDDDVQFVGEQSVSKENDEASIRQAEAKFKNGYVAEKIVGAIAIDGRINFLVKWQDRIECDIIGSSTARQKCPHLIINFYESNIRWS